MPCEAMRARERSRETVRVREDHREPIMIARERTTQSEREPERAKKQARMIQREL